jgi:hypothetical protein
VRLLALCPLTAMVPPLAARPPTALIQHQFNRARHSDYLNSTPGRGDECID